MENVLSALGGPGGYLVGRFLLIFFVGLVLTPFVSWLVLRHYRAATRKLMRHRADPDQKRVRYVAKATNPQRPSLRIEWIEGDEVVKSTARQPSRARKTAVRGLRCTALVYIVAGAIYTALYVPIFLFTLQAEIQSSTLVSFDNLLLFGLIFFWPTIVILNLVYATSTTDSLMLLGAYFGLFFLTVIAEVLFFESPEIVSTLIRVWLLVNLLPTILVYWFMQRRLSAAVPLLFPFVIFGCTGSTLMLDAVRFLTGSSGGDNLGLLVARVIGLLTFVAIAYFLLRLTGRLYLAHRFGDVEYLAMSLLLPFWILHTTLMALDYPLFVFPAFFGLFIYWLVLRLGFAFNRRRRIPPSDPIFFLMLRVFALGRKSELFFDSFSKLWRRSGVITMISGPDLVNRLIEPYEFLQFLSGQLSRRFIQGQDDFENRLAQIDTLRDPDGRYRVQEYFCYADTWKMTMQSLAQLSQGILMDLRSFSESNNGCKYEIETLINKVDLRQIIFLTDDTTNKKYLLQIINELWRSVSPRSPNALRTDPVVRLFELSGRNARNTAPWLLDLLAGNLRG